MSARRFLTLFALGTFAVTPAAKADWQINWNSFLNGPSSTLILTDATTIPTNGYTFALGSFGNIPMSTNAFVPSLTNISQWSGQFKIFDTADYTDAPDPYFSGMATLLNDRTSTSTNATPGATFAPGERVYIWIYNSFDLLAINPPTQWALFSGPAVSGDTNFPAWVWPENTIEPCCLALTWNVAEANEPAFGGVNGDRGPGEYEETPEEFQVQLAVVPEPSVFALVGLGGVLLAIRRRLRSRA